MNLSIAPNDQQQKEDQIIKKTIELTNELVAISQAKSDYVLQNFVVNQHDTIPARKRQALLELQIRMFNIRRSQLTAEKIRFQIDEKSVEILELEESGDGEDRKNASIEAKANIKRIEIEELRINLEELELARIGQLREAETLYNIVQKYPVFTAEQYQADEVNYWMLRLGRQAILAMKETGWPGIGNADAIRMMEVPENDDLAVWLKGLSAPVNSPQELVSTVIAEQLNIAEQRAQAIEAAQAAIRTQQQAPQDFHEEAAKAANERIDTLKNVAFSGKKKAKNA